MRRRAVAESRRRETSQRVVERFGDRRRVERRNDIVRDGRLGRDSPRVDERREEALLLDRSTTSTVALAAARPESPQCAGYLRECAAARRTSCAIICWRAL